MQWHRWQCRDISCQDQVLWCWGFVSNIVQVPSAYLGKIMLNLTWFNARSVGDSDSSVSRCCNRTCVRMIACQYFVFLWHKAQLSQTPWALNSSKSCVYNYRCTSCKQCHVNIPAASEYSRKLFCKLFDSLAEQHLDRPSLSYWSNLSTSMLLFALGFH